MSHIQVLDQITIDKIAAGEVIERPSSIVKELVENAIDAQATSVTVEIQQGGISLIRITDNGTGIQREDVRNAFLRHSTSKIRQVEDLTTVVSLGFRGEALSSIAAVTQTELITKTKDELFGTRYFIAGGKEERIEDAGAPDGTTFMIRQLFYNVPARRKFLKTATTEAGHVQELLMRLALSHPEVALQFLNNGQEKLRTSGNGKLKDVIYSIYGREVAASLLEINYGVRGIHISGYLGKPSISRGNRNFESFFVNGRYVKSAMISKAVEDAYRDFVMHHKFPFVVLHFEVDGEDIDVNVHPTKMELRFQNQQDVYSTIYEAVHRTLLEPELIPLVSIPEPVKQENKKSVPPANANETVQKSEPTGVTTVAYVQESSPFLLKPKVKQTEPFGRQIAASVKASEEPAAELTAESAAEPAAEAKTEEEYFLQKMKERVLSYHNRNASVEVADVSQIYRASQQTEKILQAVLQEEKTPVTQETVLREAGSYEAPAEQMNLFEEKLLRRDIRADYKLIGQLFDTYWLVQFQDNLYIIDQHAAHERVLYEKTLREMISREFTAQYLSPPIILSLSMQEIQLLQEHMERFERIGFEIEPFGGEEYAVRAVPGNLFGIAKKQLLMEMLDSLGEGITTSMAPDLIDEKIASLSCKAAVKGNNRLSSMEVDSLIGELLTLDNPYHCPHGRPTIIAMTKRELEKKFKRIV